MTSILQTSDFPELLKKHRDHTGLRTALSVEEFARLRVADQIDRGEPVIVDSVSAAAEVIYGWLNSEHGFAVKCENSASLQRELQRRRQYDKNKLEPRARFRFRPSADRGANDRVIMISLEE